MNRTYIQHYKSLFTLGIPIVIGQVGVIILGFADTLMIGHHSTNELAAASFVNFQRPVCRGVFSHLYGFHAGHHFCNRLFVWPDPYCRQSVRTRGDIGSGENAQK